LGEVEEGGIAESDGLVEGEFAEGVGDRSEQVAEMVLGAVSQPGGAEDDGLDRGRWRGQLAMEGMMMMMMMMVS
jgi:hypothetical protein